MPQGTPREQPISDAELKDLLENLRNVNLLFTQGRITWEDRIRLHQVLVPGIGNLEGRLPRDHVLAMENGDDED